MLFHLDLLLSMVCSVVRLNILVRYDTDLRVLEQLLVDKVKYYKGEPITEDKDNLLKQKALAILPDVEEDSEEETIED